MVHRYGFVQNNTLLALVMFLALAEHTSSVGITMFGLFLLVGTDESENPEEAARWDTLAEYIFALLIGGGFVIDNIRMPAWNGIGDFGIALMLWPRIHTRLKWLVFHDLFRYMEAFISCALLFVGMGVYWLLQRILGAVAP